MNRTIDLMQHVKTGEIIPVTSRPKGQAKVLEADLEAGRVKVLARGLTQAQVLDLVADLANAAKTLE